MRRTERRNNKPTRVPARAHRWWNQPSAIGLGDTECLTDELGDEAKSRSLSTEHPPTGKPDAGEPPVRFGGRGSGHPLSLPLSPGNGEWSPPAPLRHPNRLARNHKKLLENARFAGIALRRRRGVSNHSISDGSGEYRKRLNPNLARPLLVGFPVGLFQLDLRILVGRLDTIFGVRRPRNQPVLPGRWIFPVKGPERP